MPLEHDLQGVSYRREDVISNGATQIVRSVPNSLVPEMEVKTFETVIWKKSDTNQILFLMAQNIYLETLFSKFLSTGTYVQVAHYEIYPQETDQGGPQTPVKACYRQGQSLTRD